jgi:hypothetical protein
MNRAQKVQFGIWLATWLVALGYFWFWWLRPEHTIGTFSSVLNLIVIAWMTIARSRATRHETINPMPTLKRASNGRL